MEPLPDSEQPEWLDDIVEMASYGVEVTDARLAKKDHYGTDIVAVQLETTSERQAVGHWYYDDLPDSWLWSRRGGVLEVARDALDEVIKPNIDLSRFD